MRAFSMDLRERIVAVCASGETAASVALRFDVCSRTVQRYVERARRDALVPTAIPGRPPRLAREQEAAFLALVEESPNRTLLQLQEEWQKQSGGFLPSSTLHDCLKRLGGRYKKRVALPAHAVK
jgi:transposase